MIFIFLFVYFLVFFGIAFAMTSYLVARRIWKNPIVLPKDDSAYWIIGRYFKSILLILFIYTLVLAVYPDIYSLFFPIQIPYTSFIRNTGCMFLGAGMIVTFLAQVQMKDSWRIGIDTDKKTELVTSWIFQYSRNPIFLGMTLALLWLFLVTPNMFTLAVLYIWHILIQIQIRFEEDFLEKQHGAEYMYYKKRVKRMA